MSSAFSARVVGDWGTSSLRLWRLPEADRGGIIPERVSGPGVKYAGDCATVLSESLRQLLACGEQARVTLSGMVGSSMGLVDAGYLDTPLDLHDLPGNLVTASVAGRSIQIVPGVRTRNPHGLPDLMRGEETQLMGSLLLGESGSTLYCLPGTHTKWAWLRESCLETFVTSMTGELYECLRSGSILATNTRVADDSAIYQAAFATGVRTLQDNHDANILHLLFSARSRRLGDEIEEAGIEAYLSGLLIAADVLAALRLFGCRDATVTIIGSTVLGAAYRCALDAFGVTARVVDGDAASVAGLRALQDAWPGEDR